MEKNLDELAQSLVFEYEDGREAPRQLEHAKKVLADNQRLVEVLRAPLDKNHGVVAQGPDLLREYPLSQQQSMNRYDEYSTHPRGLLDKVGIRAAKTAGTIRRFPRATVISLVDKAGRSQICVEKSLFRAVCKLVWFRVKSWWTFKK